ncbi:MAG: cell envelope integrity protein TolA [Alphaproteobacteria bacterium]|nr:cell envelope integrity protein TolA [Alphaproteobacteria bacterium]
MTVAQVDSMPERRGVIYSAIMHLLIVLAVVLGLPSVFQTRIDEEQPIVVQLVNIGPKTLATIKTLTPPKEKAPPKVAEIEPKKPTPPQPQQSKPSPPQPPPEPKPAEVKVPEKPTPPKPEAKSQPPQPPQPLPKQKRQDLAFDALLKNLAAKPLPQEQSTQPATKPQPSSQPVAPLGSQLSVSELDLVKQQIEQCWNVPAGARDAQNLTPEFHVYMNPDGTVRSATLMNPERLTDPFFQAAADSARRALFNPSCQPLKLPPQKYDQWQTFTITFDPKDLS